MAERTVDPAVDDLRRRARRRLVGAVVLALAAAVLLPMLLEKEPRPLGEDVAVRIPPVDEGKFVNRLSDPPKRSSDEAKAAASAPAAPATPAPSTAPESAPVPAAAPSMRGAATEPDQRAVVDGATAAPQGSAERMPEPKIKTEAAAEAKPEATAAPKAEAKVPAGSNQASAPKTKAGEGFVVQLAAFSDDKGANALASKLKRNGYPAYTEPVRTSRGTLFRVRVGGYPSREAAGDVRNRLKGEGYPGIVAATR